MDHKADNLEIEVKFHLRDPKVMQQRLQELGATQGPKVFETNSRFDDSDDNLLQQGRLLRLRRDHGCRLTHKSRPADADQEVKVYHELEVEIGDYDTMTALLEAIGFHAVQVYEKWRQTFTLHTAEICIDILPYGSFLEIEAEKKQIIEISQQLGLSWGKRILTNYLAIFDIIRIDRQLPFTDVTFDNFSRQPVDIKPYLPKLEAGNM